MYWLSYQSTCVAKLAETVLGMIDFPADKGLTAERTSLGSKHALTVASLPRRLRLSVGPGAKRRIRLWRVGFCARNFSGYAGTQLSRREIHIVAAETGTGLLPGRRRGLF
jgi:hypothetical protein